MKKLIIALIFLFTLFPVVSFSQSGAVAQAAVNFVTETTITFAGIANDTMPSGGVYSTTFITAVGPAKSLVAQLVNATTAAYTRNGTPAPTANINSTLGTYVNVEIYGCPSILPASAVYIKLDTITTFAPKKIDITGMDSIYAKLVGDATDFDVTVYARGADFEYRNVPGN